MDELRELIDGAPSPPASSASASSPTAATPTETGAAPSRPLRTSIPAPAPVPSLNQSQAWARSYPKAQSPHTMATLPHHPKAPWVGLSMLRPTLRPTLRLMPTEAFRAARAPRASLRYQGVASSTPTTLSVVAWASSNITKHTLPFVTVLLLPFHYFCIFD